MLLSRSSFLLLLAALAGCHASDTTEPPATLPPLDVTSDFIVVPDTTLLVTGIGRQFGVETTDRYQSALGSAEWTSSDPSVATVNRDGYVKAVGEGHAIISVTSDGRTASAPVRVQRYAAPLRFVQVSAVSGTTCGVTTSGEIYCWGAGALGTAQTVDACETLYAGSQGMFRSTYRCSSVPVRVESDVRFTSVTASFNRACALDASGARYCWGVLDNVTRPVPQRTADTLHFASLASRCGVTLGGDAYCWGPNTSGALGTGSSATPDAPVDDPVLVSGGIKWKAVDSGDIAACGISLDGVAYCWGDDWRQQLGIGTIAKDPECFLEPCRFAPTPVSTSARFTQISVGSDAVCALTGEGEAYCWGWGFVPGAFVSVPTSVGPQRFDAIAVGDLAFCGLTKEGKMLCWGYGGVGLGSIIPGTSAPAEAALPVQLHSVAKPSLFNGCGMGTDNLVYCWGHPSYANGMGTVTAFGFNGAYSPADAVVGTVIGQQ